MKKFKSVKNGKKFKMSKDSGLSYTKKNKTEASCDQGTFGIILHPDHLVIQID